MPQPAIQSPVFAQAFALPATTPANSITIPVRPGFRPYTEKTRGKRPALMTYDRRLAAATAPGTAAPIGVFGCDLTYETNAPGVDINGRIIPGYDPGTSPLNLAGAVPGGCYVEQIRVSGGAGTGIGFVPILNPGSGYTSAPTVTFTGLGAAAGTALISADGRVVGILLTNTGTYSASGTVAIAAPTNGVTAVAAVTAGQVTTVNTHIPFATHAPTTAGGAIWFATVKIGGNDRIIACSTAIFAPTANTGLDPDQHLIGTAANYGFTVATGTNPDGTTLIGVLTLGVGIPNGATVTVWRGLVRQIMAPVATNGIYSNQVKCLDAMWLGGNATAGATETSVLSVGLEPAVVA
jgi:hypothetical protein